MKPTTIHAMLPMALLALAIATPAGAHASRAGLAQLGDPYLPPQARAAARAHALAARPATSGAGLRAQALDLLRQAFDQADTAHTGQVSKAQAQRAGFGYLVNHFEQIDSRRRGHIRFDQVEAYLRARGADL